MRIHFASGLELVLSVYYYDVAGREATGDGCDIILRKRNRDRTNIGRLVGLDHEHIAALRPVLHRD